MVYAESLAKGSCRAVGRLLHVVGLAYGLAHCWTLNICMQRKLQVHIELQCKDFCRDSDLRQDNETPTTTLGYSPTGTVMLIQTIYVASFRVSVHCCLIMTAVASVEDLGVPSFLLIIYHLQIYWFFVLLDYTWVDTTGKLIFNHTEHNI